MPPPRPPPPWAGWVGGDASPRPLSGLDESSVARRSFSGGGGGARFSDANFESAGGGSGGDGMTSDVPVRRRSSAGDEGSSSAATQIPPNRSALEAAAVEHLREHGARAAAAFRDGPRQRQLREVSIRRMPGVPLGLLLKVDPAADGAGAIVVVRSLTPGGYAETVLSPANRLRPGDRIILINGVDLASVHHTKVVGMLDVPTVTFHVDDSLHTPRPMGHEYGMPAVPWQGPLAQDRPRLGPPGNPFATPPYAASGASAGGTQTGRGPLSQGTGTGPPPVPQPPFVSLDLPPPRYEEAVGPSGGMADAGALPTKGVAVTPVAGTHAFPIVAQSMLADRSPYPPQGVGGGLFEVHVTRNMIAGTMLPLGIDVQLQHQLAAAEGQAPLLANVLVKWVRPGGAAAQNGMVQGGDYIVTVQHVPVTLLTEAAFFEHLRATTLVLGVSRPIRTI